MQVWKLVPSFPKKTPTECRPRPFFTCLGQGPQAPWVSEACRGLAHHFLFYKHDLLLLILAPLKHYPAALLGTLNGKGCAKSKNDSEKYFFEIQISARIPNICIREVPIAFRVYSRRRLKASMLSVSFLLSMCSLISLSQEVYIPMENSS